MHMYIDENKERIIKAIKQNDKPSGKILAKITLTEEEIIRFNTKDPLIYCYLTANGFESHPVCEKCKESPVRFLSTKKGFNRFCIGCVKNSLSENNKINNASKNKKRSETLNLLHEENLKLAVQEYCCSKERIKDLEQKFQLPNGRLRKFLHSEGLVHRKSKSKNFLDSVNQKLLDSNYLQNCANLKLSLSYVAGELDVSPNTVRLYALRHGIRFENSTTTSELEMKDFLEGLGFNVRIHDRSVIKPLEIDVYVPERKLGLEYHGLYWHNENENKHLSKQIRAEDNGIDLIQFFDFEWDLYNQKVKSIISSRLGKNEKSYQARKCSIQQISSERCNKFMEKNHLQGSCNHSLAYGLVFDDELVSCVSFAKPRFNKNFNSELIRFANKLNCNVIGGFSKLLNHYVKENGKSIISYSHRRLFKGEVYKKNGFELINLTKPSYFWIDNRCKVLKRYQTQKHKLANLLGDRYNPNLTEIDNMLANGYKRVWDCGQRVFALV